MIKLLKRFLFVIIVTISFAFLFGTYNNVTFVVSNIFEGVAWFSVSTVLVVLYFVFIFTIECFELFKVISRKWLIRIHTIVFEVQEQLQDTVKKSVFYARISHLKLSVVRC